MNAIAFRNIRVFFRDRLAVFFSFLSVFIILGLYIVFLGDLMAEGLPDAPGVRHLINNWVMAGILAVTSITSTMGAFGIMVEDRARRALKDFTASPLRRSHIAGGYVLSAVAIGLIMSFVTLLLAELYIVLMGGQWLSFVKMLQVAGLLVLAVLASSAIMFFIASFLKSQHAFSTAGTVIGTLVGFLTGIYIPIGSLPEAVQWVIKLFPISHAGALIRSIMMEQPMAVTFAGAPSDAIKEFELRMGVMYQFGDWTVTPGASIAILIGTTLLFYALSIIVVSRKSR